MELLSPVYLLSVLLIFVRIGGLLVAAPFFSHRSFPVQLRVLVAVLLAYVLAGFVGSSLPPYATHPLGFIAALAVEAMTGLMLGFAAQFVFWGVQFAGDIIGFQMGLGMAQVYNPIDGFSGNPLESFLRLSFLLVFVLLDGHHQLLRALTISFEAVPLGGANLAATGPLLLQWTRAFFTIALRLAAPFMITIFLIDVALGFFARIMPQANLFILGLPLKLLVGFSLFYFFLQHLLPLIPILIDGMHSDLLALIEAMAAR